MDKTSDYEKIREETIRENLEKMQQLGIPNIALKLKSTLKSPSNPPQHLLHMLTTPVPVRRSSRTIVAPSTQLHHSSSQISTLETCNETPNQEVTNTENNDFVDTGTKCKKRRGPALALKDWGKDGFRLELNFNEFIQVEGPNSGPFSSQLGILARCGSRLPLEYETWRKVLKVKKEAVWTEIKMNTNVQEEYKENCLMKIGEI